MSRLQAPRNEETGAPSSAGTTAANLKDLDQLAGEVRDPGPLSEPLADSILEYSLQRLFPTEGVHSRAIQELEDAMRPDQLAQLIEEHFPGHPKVSPAPVANLDGGQMIPMSGVHGNNNLTPLTGIVSAGSEEWMRKVQIPASQAYAYDWWDLSLDTLQQPILPYEDLLGLNSSM